MTQLITPPAVLRDPFVEQPETRESGDQVYHITLEFSAIEAVRPLIKQIEKLMPKNGASPLRVVKTEVGRVWRIKLRRPDQPKVLGPDLETLHPHPLKDGDLVRAQMGLMSYTTLGAGVMGYLGDIQFLSEAGREEA